MVVLKGEAYVALAMLQIALANLHLGLIFKTCSFVSNIP